MLSQRFGSPNNTLRRAVPLFSALLLAYGTVGVVVNMRLFSLLIEGVGGWLGGRVAWDAPLRIGLLSPLEAHFDARPWLPWLAWLLGAALLVLRPALSTASTHSSDALIPPSVRIRSPLLSWLPFVVLALLLIVGCVGRMVELWPEGYGISRFPYDDEGVYAGTSQLFLQGILPYRDYFFAHPPIAAVAYAPAMFYHFNEWGSPTSFMMARYLSVFYSLVTLAFLFGIGYRLTGLWGGTVAAGLWAIDGRVVEINRKIMLEGPLVLLSCAAVLLYMWVRPRLTESAGTGIGTASPSDGRSRFGALRSTDFALFMVGLLATLSALTKIAGLACLLAILADMVWLWWEGRRTRRQNESTDPARNNLQPIQPASKSVSRNPLLSIFLGILIALVLLVGPFLILAPSQFIREVLFFQFLRPSDGVVDSPARVNDLTATLANALTPLLAALGVVVLTGWVWSRSGVSLGPWRVGILWTFFSLILFTYSRSFYQHYYIQLAAPLCMLGAGVSLAPALWRQLASGARSSLTVYVPGALLAVIGLPLLLIQWSGLTTRQCPHCEDHLFEIVGRYVNNAVPPGAEVLSTDEQFNLLAARPPSHLPSTGYLVDSYGHMISLALELDTRDWGDLLAASLRGEHGDDPYAVMQSVRPQSDFLERALRASLIVVHERGAARLTDGTLEALGNSYSVAEQQTRYTIYRGASSAASP